MTEQSLIASMSSDMEYSLGKDVIRNNLLGTSFSTSIVLCNARKWHGLLSIYEPQHGCNKVILSTLDDSVVVGGDTYNISVRKYPDVYYPTGNQYICAASFNPYPSIHYHFGDDILLRKEMVLATDEATLLIKYTLVSSNRPVKIRIRPIVAFRLANELRRYTTNIISGNTPITNGIAYRPNDNEPVLYMQTNIQSEFVTAPDWNYNIEYPRDQMEGKSYQEDLFMPGFFEVELVSSQEFVLSASLMQQNVDYLSDLFTKMASAFPRRESYADCIEFAAKQMIREDANGYNVLESMPPSNYHSKDVCGALPGLTLPNNNYDMFRKVAKTYINMYRTGIDGNIDYAPETPLWFIWGIQQYAYQQNDRYLVFKDYGSSIAKVISDMTNNRMNGIFVDTDGLVLLRQGGKDVYYIEVNAMWYNSLMFMAELYTFAKYTERANNTLNVAQMTKKAILDKFFNDETGLFADSFDSNGGKDEVCRPGQLLAFALPYPIADNEMAAGALPILERKLHTPVGLRTMDVNNPKYDEEGAISPFNLGFLVELYLRVLGRDGIDKAESIYRSLDTNLNELLPPSFYEFFTPNPPYEGLGSPMSAVAIAAINRIKLLISQF